MNPATRPGLLRPDWPAPAGVRAAFSLRTGGLSQGAWSGLNLGAHVGDAPDAVAGNRRLLREALDLPGEPLWLEQVHGAEVLQVGEPGPAAAPPRFDAVVTRLEGRVLAIMVADCLPVLLASRDGEVIGAAHAGWRGLAAGVLENTVAAMAVPPKEIVAWIGPAIGPDRFEVGDEVRDALLASAPSATALAEACFTRNPAGRWQCDLAGLARLRLTGLGVAAVAGGEWCTAADPARFFSHRRDGCSGRMAALLWREARPGARPQPVRL
jgi:YfiH family protein